MKLLHKSLRIYLLFSVIIFAASIPVFYFLVQDLWIEDVDESLIYQKDKIITGIGSSDFDSTTIGGFTDIASKLDLGISIVPLTTIQPDQDTIYYNELPRSKFSRDQKANTQAERNSIPKGGVFNKNGINFFDNTNSHEEPYRELRSFVHIKNQYYKILIRKDLVESADLIQSIVITEAFLFLLLLVGILLLNSYFSKKTWLPFYHLVNQLKSFKIEKGQVFKTQKSDIDEFEELNKSVLILTENNIKVFKSQNEFTENAAHETQTPLAVIKNQIDLLAQDENLSQEQAEIINRIDKNIRFITKLNRNLLLLSKIENVQFDRTEEVDLSSIVTEIIDIFNEQAELKGIKLILNLNSKPIIQSNSYLVHALISNLLKNAIKYNIPEGYIEIRLNDDSFLISNSGVNRALPKDAIFERFFKKSDQTESSGLGLAIAKQISNLLDFDLKYEFKKENDHVFSINFRLS